MNFFLLLGIGLGLIYLPAIVSVTYYFEKRRAFATGLAVCGSGLGTFIFAPLSKILVETYTWKGAVLIEAGLLLNCIVCGALFRPLEMETKKVTMDSDDEEPVANGRIYTGSEHPKMNGHIPTVVVHSDTDEETPTANGVPLNLPLLRVKREVSASAHSLPFQGLNSPKKAEANNLRRHASDNMLHKKPKRRRTYTNTSQKSEDNQHKARPMARKDIFYTSSLHNIPMYRSNPNMYTRSILSLPDASSEEDLTKSCSCIPNYLRCSPEMKDAFRQMMDFSLLKNPLFLMFAISNLFTSIGFCVPYTFLPDRAILLGIHENKAAFLIAVIGIANTVGRVVFGWLSDRPFVNRLWLYNTALTLCGICTALSAFCTTYELLAAYAASFGVFIGEYGHTITNC